MKCRKIWQLFRKIFRFLQENLTIFVEKSDSLYWNIWRFFKKICRFFKENLTIFTGKFTVFTRKSDGPYRNIYNFSEKFGDFLKKICRFLQENLWFLQENLTIFVEKSSGLYTNIWRSHPQNDCNFWPNWAQLKKITSCQHKRSIETIFVSIRPFWNFTQYTRVIGH